jgi:hypothetical protein
MFVEAQQNSLFIYLFSFSFGVALAPYSSGFVVLLVFWIIWEIVVALIYKRYYHIDTLGTTYWLQRITAVALYMFGFILGRIAIGMDDFGLPTFNNDERREHHRKMEKATRWWTLE